MLTDRHAISQNYIVTYCMTDVYGRMRGTRQQKNPTQQMVNCWFQTQDSSVNSIHTPSNQYQHLLITVIHIYILFKPLAHMTVTTFLYWFWSILHLNIFIISFYTSRVSNLCISHTWWWPHNWPQHVVHCMYKQVLRGGAGKSSAQPTSRCRRMELIVSLEQGVCSCANCKSFLVTEAEMKHVWRRTQF